MTTQQDTQNVTITPLTVDELPEVRDLVGAIARKGLGTIMRVDFGKTLDTMARSITQEFGVVMLARAGDSGQPVGFIYGFALPHDFYVGTWGFERLLWVSPEWRGRTLGRRLLRCFEAWCESKECVAVQMGEHSLASKGERVGGLYRALGYEEQEKTWRKSLT